MPIGYSRRMSGLELMRLEWSNSEDDKPTLVETRDLHWAMRSRLFYEDGRLVRIEREDEDTRLDAGQVEHSVVSIFYDAMGRRERIEQAYAGEPNAEPRILFQSKAGAVRSVCTRSLGTAGR